MADENYTLPENPEYDENIRRLQNDDPGNADEIFNPLFQKIINNIRALKLKYENIDFSEIENKLKDHVGSRGEEQHKPANGDEYGFSKNDFTDTFRDNLDTLWEFFTEVPGAPTNFLITRQDGQLILNWIHSTSERSTGTKIVYKTGSYPTLPTDGTVIDIEGEPRSAGAKTITGLINGETYYFSLFAYTLVLNFSTPTQENAAPIADVGAISNFTAAAGVGKIDLSWTNPGGTFQSVMIVRKTGSYSAAISDGTVVYNSFGNSYTDTGLTAGTTYYYRAFTTNGVNVNDTTTGQQVSATPISLSTTFSANTWAQISMGSDLIETNGWNATQVETNLGWKIGDTKPVPMNGTNYNFRIIDFNKDNKTGGGKAGITLEMASSYGTTTADRRYMNATNTNVGGWTSSYMRQTVLNIDGSDIGSFLPSDLKLVLKPVDKLTSPGNNVGTPIQTTSDKLFLLSEIEVLGTASRSFAGEGSQYAWYSTNNTAADRIKQQPAGTNYTWWKRSPNSGNTTDFCTVLDNGNAFHYFASGARGVSFGLCV